MRLTSRPAFARYGDVHPPHSGGHERRGRIWALWLAVLVAVTAVMFALRPRLDEAHVALGFLLVVLGGSSAGGRVLGVALSALAFLLFNFLFLTPYYTLVIANPLDWMVLVAFLITGIVAAQLLNRAQERAEVARQRAVEVQRLAALGSETLNAGRAEDVLLGIAEVIRSTIGVACCEILVPSEASADLRPLARAGSCAGGTSRERDGVASPQSLGAWVVANRAIAAEQADGTTWVGATSQPDDSAGWLPHGGEIRTLLVPLTVRSRAVGVLRISDGEPFTLDPSREQFLSALSYYAALGVERVRLVAESERAEAFRQADALKTALIATVSHDLRTPLTTIKALAHELAERGQVEAASIEEEADRLNRFVADLLDLSRIAANALPLHVELNDAADLVGTAMQRLRGTLGGRQIQVVHEPAGAMLFGTFDFVQSLRVLVNLIENAIKYSPAPDPVELRVHREGDRLCFVVIDRGPGVPRGEADLIFQPFYRPAGSPPDVGGAGLGLAIARGLAVAQHGTVRYEPRAGGGSVFTFELPAADAPALFSSF
jgi:two-component system, OmpR family, sensor histidine kinase KdpD